MALSKQLIAACLLLVLTASVEQYYSDYRQGFAAKKGLTFQATVWPE